MAKPYGWILAALLSSHWWNLDSIVASAFSNNRIILRNNRIIGELGIVIRRRSTPGGGRTVLPSSAMSSSSSSSGPTLSWSAVVRRSPRRRAVGAAPPRGEVVSSSNSSSSSSSSASASSSSTDDDDGDASRTLLEGWMRHDHHDYHVNMLSPARAYEVRVALVGWYRNRRRKLPWRGDGGPYDGSTAGYGAGSSGGGGGGGGMTKRGGANNGGSGNKNKKRRGEGEGGKADAPDIRSFFASSSSSSSSSSSGNEKTKPGGSKAPPPLPPRDGTNAKNADDDGGESDSFDAPREVTAYGVWGEFSLFSCIIWPLLWRDESSSRHWLAKHLCRHAVPIHVLLQFRRSCSSRRGWRRSYPTGSNVSSPTHTSRVTSIEMAGIESNIILGSNRFFFTKISNHARTTTNSEKGCGVSRP